MNIFFDLDGTLLEISKKYYYAHKKASEKVNLQPLSYTNYWQAKRNRVSEDTILKLNSASHKFKTYQNERIRLLEDISALNLDKPFPWVYGLLNYLVKAHKLYLVTVRRNKENLNRELKKFKLINFFVKILIANPKGDPILAKEKLVKKFKLSKEDLLIGDTEVDIITAHRLGIKSVAVSTGIRTRIFLKHLKPDFLVKDVSALLKESKIISL